MKKILNLTIVLFHLLIFQEMYAQKGSYPNPAAMYCERMGYEYQVIIDDDGNQKGICTLPDSSQVDAWEFFKGKVKKEYSYCAKKGYTVETKIVKKGNYTTECAYCKKEKTKDSKEKSTKNQTEFEEIPMRELMARNQESLILNEVIDNSNDAPVMMGSPSLKSTSNLPSSFDWRNHNGHAYIGPIRDQGSCGSCYAFGAAACAEGAYNKATGSFDTKRKEFSESFIMWCLGGLPAYSSHFGGCNGADYDYMELEALSNEGICERSYFPYVTSSPSSCTHWNDPKGIFSDWQRVSCNDISAIKTAIMDYGVVDAAVYVTSSFDDYSGGIYSDSYTSCNGSPCSYTTTNHAIALVGWGYDATLGDYWILRNSWGTSWGESGYMRIKATSARVACAVTYLVPDPVVYEADNISESNQIPSGSNVEFNGHNSITLQPGFKSELGSTFKADILAASTKSATIISINEFDKMKKFTFKNNKESRLKSSSINSNESHETLLIEEINSISVYPNPVSDFINIIDISESTIDKVQIFNSNGMVVNCEIENSISPIIIDISNFTQGVYYIQIQIGNDFLTKKIIKQ
jgi:C1A family cysteine protease